MKVGEFCARVCRRSFGIEVKAAATVSGKDFNGLRHLRESTPAAVQARDRVLYRRAGCALR